MTAIFNVQNVVQPSVLLKVACVGNKHHVTVEF